MNRTTLVMVALALVSLGTAVALRPVELTPAEDDDSGEPLFGDFTDPALAARLEVQAWDPGAATVRSFSVELRDGRWLIPSHHDYPADATERMGRAAASFVDVERDVIRSDDPAEHASFGVQDPADPDASDGGRGLRVRIADASGNMLVDVIVGKPVPDRPGHRFVRLPEQPRVYASQLELDVSTSFSDWIEADLMRIEAAEVEGLISDPYRVDENTGMVEDRRPIAFVRGDLADFIARALAAENGDGADADAPPELPDVPADQWAPGPGIELAEGQQPDQAAIGGIVAAIDGLQIVDVSPRPPLLDVEVLGEKGFFVNEERRLFGNEGEITIINDDGVTYTLYFGEETGDWPEGWTGEANASGRGRFMFVQVDHDPEMDRGADPPVDGQLRGKERAEELARHFDRWFFVIDDESFRAIHKAREDLLTEAPAPVDEPG